ncbi:MAG TPA: polyphenol oxidase family protein [Thermoanaerobaculia bacterium]
MWTIESSSIGRIAVPPDLPPGTALFCTTRDFRGMHPFADSLLGVTRERFGVEASLTTCTQIHSATVTGTGRTKRWRECDACDALWSAEREVALGIKVADCLPVTMIDPVHSVIANVHSGWRGAAQRITSATLDSLTRETGFDPASAHAFLGPSIRVCCFEVGEEVVTEFAKSYRDAEQYVERNRSKPHVDLVKLTTDVLRERGITRISDSGLCTRCEGSIFHSFRRDGKGGGRNLQVVAH